MLFFKDKHLLNNDNKSEWKPVYCRGLDLVTFLIENSSLKIKTSTYDFIELHGDYLRELLKLVSINFYFFPVLLSLDFYLMVHCS